MTLYDLFDTLIVGAILGLTCLAVEWFIPHNKDPL